MSDSDEDPTVEAAIAKLRTSYIEKRKKGGCSRQATSNREDASSREVTPNSRARQGTSKMTKPDEEDDEEVMWHELIMALNPLKHFIVQQLIDTLMCLGNVKEGPGARDSPEAVAALLHVYHDSLPPYHDNASSCTAAMSHRSSYTCMVSHVRLLRQQSLGRGSSYRSIGEDVQDDEPVWAKRIRQQDLWGH